MRIVVSLLCIIGAICLYNSYSYFKGNLTTFEPKKDKDIVIVKKKYRRAYTRQMGIAFLIIGLGFILYSILTWIFRLEIFLYILVVVEIVGFGLVQNASAIRS